MNRSIYIILLLSLLTLVGCRKSDLINEPVTEGSKTSVRLSLLQIAPDDPWNSPLRSPGLTTPQEQTVATLDILVFNAAGRLVSRQKLLNPTLSSAQYLTTQSGAGMSIHAIANATAQAADQSGAYDMLSTVSTIADLQNLKVYNLSSDITTNSTLVMYGAASGVTIAAHPAANTITIPLAFVAAKARVNIVSSLPAGESFQLTDWSVKSYPLFSYLVPRAGDAVSAVADFGTGTFSGSTWEDKSDILLADGITTKAGKTTVFYTYENRRGTTTNSDPTKKTGLAPSSATAIVFRGYYHTASAVNAVVATVMLGTNSTNDYNVSRSNQYTYTVEVKGFNNISVDTRYTSGNAGFKVDLLNPTLDAHYDWRPLNLSSLQGTASIEILDAAGNPVTSGFWLTLSTRDIVHFVNNGSGTYIRPTYTPATDLVYNIQNIAFTDPAVMVTKNYFLYADEYLTDGATRTAQVRITNTLAAFGPAQTLTLNVTQQGAQTMGTVGLRDLTSAGAVTTTNYTLAVENQEEASMYITPGNTANENTATMQWGFPATFLQSAITPYTLRAGSVNSLLAVLNAGVLRPPYGRTGAATITEAVHNPIFNTYAARYCFEKNRDLDGNGAITGSEIRWYLPSNDELLLIYAGLPSLARPVSPNTYWSSTESSSGNAFRVNFASGGANLGTAKGTPGYVRCVRALY